MCLSHHPLYILALNLEKAYNSIDRYTLDAIMTHMGVADTAFYRLYTNVHDVGTTYITGPTSLSPPFHTTRGIKQGCPLSPALFTLLLSGMHRYLELHTSPADVPSTPVATFPAFSYPDNIVLLAHITFTLAHSHALVA